MPGKGTPARPGAAVRAQALQSETYTALDALNAELAREYAKAAVDVAGIVDPTPISDAIGGWMSLRDGDVVGAGLSLLSMVPYVGDALGKTVKGSRAAARIADLQKRIGALSVTTSTPTPQTQYTGSTGLAWLRNRRRAVELMLQREHLPQRTRMLVMWLTRLRRHSPTM